MHQHEQLIKDSCLMFVRLYDTSLTTSTNSVAMAQYQHSTWRVSSVLSRARWPLHMIRVPEQYELARELTLAMNSVKGGTWMGVCSRVVPIAGRRIRPAAGVDIVVTRF